MIAVALALLSIVLAGCRGGEVNVTIHENGSGTVIIDVFPEPETNEALDAVNLQRVATEAERSGVEVQLSHTIDGDRPGYRVELTFDDYRDLKPVLVDGVQVLDQQVRLFQSFELTEDGGDWNLDAVLNPVDEMIDVSSAGNGRSPSGTATVTQDLDAILTTASEFAEGATLDLTLSLPGEIATTNADLQTPNSATWQFRGLDQPEVLALSTEPSGGMGLGALLVSGVAAILIVGLAAGLWSATRHHESERVVGTKGRRIVYAGPNMDDHGERLTWGPPSGSPHYRNAPADLKGLNDRNDGLPTWGRGARARRTREEVVDLRDTVVAHDPSLVVPKSSGFGDRKEPGPKLPAWDPTVGPDEPLRPRRPLYAQPKGKDEPESRPHSVVQPNLDQPARSSASARNGAATGEGDDAEDFDELGPDGEGLGAPDGGPVSPTRPRVGASVSAGTRSATARTATTRTVTSNGAARKAGSKKAGASSKSGSSKSGTSKAKREPVLDGPAPTGPPAGWYSDPAEPGRTRWWDGAHWTEHIR